jgi:hypothetical protein
MVDRVTEEIHERLERELRILESDYQRTIEAEPARTAVNGNGRAAPASGADDDSTTSEADESEAVRAPVFRELEHLNQSIRLKGAF